MKILYVFIFFYCLSSISLAQPISIGNGNYSSTSPYTPSYNYSYSQTIYLVTEIPGSGYINFLSFKYQGNSLSSSDKLKVYLGLTNKNNFDEDTSWIPASSMTLVYDETLSNYNVPGWINLQLTTPFLYDGSSNLVVAINEVKPGQELPNSSFQGTQTSTYIHPYYLRSNRNKYIFNNNSPINVNTINGGFINYNTGNIIINGLTPFTCPAVSNIVVTETSLTTSQATWNTPVGTAPILYEWEARKTGSPGSGTNGLMASGSTITKSVTFSGLTVNNFYNFYVRTKCTSGSFGVWVSAIAKSCGTTDLPYNIIFEPCTKQQYYGNGGLWYNNGIGFQNTSTFNGAPADAWFYSQPVNVSQNDTYSLSFCYEGYTGYINSFNVQGMVNLSFPSVPGGSEYSETEFSPFATGVHRVIFHCNSIADQGILSLTDIKLRKLICGKPKSIAISNITSSNALLSWTSSTLGGDSSYQLFLSNSKPWACKKLAPTKTGILGTSILLDSLLEGTQYYFSIRTIGAKGDSSNWTTIGTFSTPCKIPNFPYFEDFELSYIPSLPPCTLFTSPPSGGTLWRTTINPGFGFINKTMYHFSTFYPSDTWFFTKGVLISGGGISHRLTFKYGNNGSTTNEKLEVKFGGSPYVAAMTNLLVNLPSISGATKQTSATDFSTNLSDTIYFGFHSYASANQGQLFVDDISVDLTPVLSVTLRDFKGEKQGIQNHLSWKTTYELNNKGFEIYRSFDGTFFTPIGFVHSKAKNGNTNSELKYDFVDKNVTEVSYYYKLKQIDLDEKSTFSNTILIRRNALTHMSIVSLYPNPTIQQLEIAIQSPIDEKVNLLITDIVGKIVKQETRQLQKGKNNLTTTVTTLEKGTYLIHLFSSNGLKAPVRMFVKQ